MRTAMTLAAALLLVSASAFGQSAGEKTGINSTLGISPSTADFVKEAAMSDMLEIEAARIAQQKGERRLLRYNAAYGFFFDTDYRGLRIARYFCHHFARGGAWLCRSLAR